MKARINLTPEMLEKLAQGVSVHFRVAPNTEMVEVRLKPKASSPFDRVFDAVFETFEKLLK